jgi:hypothetical protein
MLLQSSPVKVFAGRIENLEIQKMHAPERDTSSDDGINVYSQCRRQSYTSSKGVTRNSDEVRIQVFDSHPIEHNLSGGLGSAFLLNPFRVFVTFASGYAKESTKE